MATTRRPHYTNGSSNCAVEGCDGPSHTRGWCPAHYARWHRYGDPLGAPEPRPSRTCTVAGCDKPYLAIGFCSMHWERNRKYGSTELPDRFWSKVEQRGDECWVWHGSFTDEGYGQVTVNYKRTLVHRHAYEQLVGPIPEGLHLDHLCRNRGCCNPAHLEPVTCKENLYRSPLTLASINAAKTHCKRGHEFDAENTIRSKSGARQCRECSNQLRRERRRAGAA